MEVKFCKCCDNLLYIYSNEENTSLYLGCKVCGNKQDYSDSKCIYSNEFSMDLSETINNSQFLNIGKKTYFHFPDATKKKVYSKGGFKHPSNVKLNYFYIELYVRNLYFM